MPEPRMYTKPFVLISIAYLCFFTSISAYNLLPLYLQSRGAHVGEIGTIMAMYSAAAILAQGGIGYILDRGWRKACLLGAAGLLMAVAIGFSATTRVGWPMYALRFFQGLGFAVYMTSSMTMIAEFAPPSRRAEAVGIYASGGLVAVALGPAVGELVIGSAGFSAFFMTTVCVSAVTLMLAGLVPTPAAIPVARPARLGWQGWAPYLPFLLPAFQYGLANVIVFVFLPPFARALQLPRVGPFYIAYTGAAILVRFVGGGLADRISRVQIIVPAMGGMTAGILLSSTLNSTWLLVLIGLLNGTGQGFAMPAANALAFERAPHGRRGQALAFYTGANLLGATVGASGFGWLAQAFGYRPAFIVASGLLAIGTYAFWRKHS